MQDLASQYGISITPIRDTLQMLGQDGLVTIRPRSGYFVTFITLKELRNILELREIPRWRPSSGPPRRIAEAELDELAHVHAGYTGDDDESYDRYTDENRRFHQLIGEASGNHELAMELARVHDRLARFMVMRHAGQSQESTHAHILAALRADDVPAARVAMLDEINETRDRLLERLMQEEGDHWRLGTHA